MIDTKNKDMSYSFAGIIATFALLPNSIMNMNALLVVSVVLIVFSLFMLFTRHRGYSLIILAMSMCIPVVFADVEVNTRGTDFLLTAYRLGLVSVFISQLFLNRIVRGHKTFLFLGLIYVVLYLIYGIFVPANRMLYNAVHFIVYVLLPFAICYNDRLSFDEFFNGATLIILATCIYAVLQFHNIYCPYSFIYINETVRLDDFFRARGILGNSLLLMGAEVFYTSLSFMRLIRKEKVYYIVLFLVLYCSLITLSRTALVIIILQLLLFFYFARTATVKTRAVLLVSLFGLVGLVFLQDPLSNLLARFSEGKEDILNSDFHRLAAFYSVWNLFSDNLMGVGPAGVQAAMPQYATSGLLRDFTLDNLFLKHIASYGILSIIPIGYLFYPFFYANKRRKKHHSSYMCVFFLFFSYALLGFSFCVDSYANMNALFYGYSGYLLTNMYNYPILIDS